MITLFVPSGIASSTVRSKNRAGRSKITKTMPCNMKYRRRMTWTEALRPECMVYSHALWFLACLTGSIIVLILFRMETWTWIFVLKE